MSSDSDEPMMLKAPFPWFGGKSRAAADIWSRMDVTSDVLDWALQNGSNPMLRIALCGYDVEYESLQAQGWQVHTWSAPSGYAGRNSQNKRERIWFSPHCLPANRLSLFEDMQ